MSLTLVVPGDDVARVRAQVRSWKLKKLFAVIIGGATRAESVRRGLAAIPRECRFVAVHDAVRPLVTSDVIESVIRAARQSKAALAATPSKDTVKLADAKRCVRSTPDRALVWLAQTPQVFERRLLERAHRKWGQTPCLKRGLTPIPTDDAMLVERLGVKVKLVEAPADNIKITRPIDLELAKCIVSA
jgi:2-C-methyl-D-erythritol 4-phosphate cytidylyltransferase